MEYKCVFCKREIEELAQVCPFCGTIEAGVRARQAYEQKQDQVVANDTSIFGKLMRKIDSVSGWIVGGLALFGAVLGVIAESSFWGILYAIPMAAFGALLLGGISWAAIGGYAIWEQFKIGVKQKVVIIFGFAAIVAVAGYLIF